MKQLSAKAVIYSLFLSTIGAAPAAAATFNLDIGPASTPTSGPCAAVQDPRSSVTYEIDDAAIGGGRSLSYASTPGPKCGGGAEAYGRAGVIGIRGDVFDGSGAPSAVSAFASMSSTNIMVSARVGSNLTELRDIFGPNISIRPNLLVSGTVETNSRSSSGQINASATISGIDSSGATSFVTENAIVASTPGELGAFDLPTSAFVSSGNVNNSPFGDGILVDPTQPISIDFNLSGRALAGFFNNNLIGAASFDSYNSLSFNPDGPAFFLPEGYTVNAPSLSIFDNKWIDPRTVSPAPSTVPLPASSLLLMAGLCGLGMMRKRRG